MTCELLPSGAKKLCGPAEKYYKKLCALGNMKNKENPPVWHSWQPQLTTATTDEPVETNISPANHD